MAIGYGDLVQRIARGLRGAAAVVAAAAAATIAPYWGGFLGTSCWSLTYRGVMLDLASPLWSDAASGLFSLCVLML